MAQRATTYCELAAYDAALLSVTNADAAAELNRVSRAGCDERLALRVIETILSLPAVQQGQARLVSRWQQERPGLGDAAAMSAWWARQPQITVTPSQWAQMSPADRTRFKLRARAWLATQPGALPAESLWLRAVRLAGQYSHLITAVAVGVVAAVIAAAVTSRRQARLPRGEEEEE